MTARQVLDGRLRWSMVAFSAGVATAAAAVAGFRAGGRDPSPSLLVAGIGVAAAASLYAHLVGLRCPWCGGNLAGLAFGQGGWRFDRRVHYCPYCRRGLDDEVAAEPSVAP